MGILCTRVTHTVRIVHCDDPDVTARDPVATGWQPFDQCDVRPGATVIGVVPLGSHDAMRASFQREAGSRVHYAALYGMRQGGSWERSLLVMSDLDERGKLAVLDLLPPVAQHQLYVFIDEITAGWDPDEKPEVTPDPPAPKRAKRHKRASSSGRKTAGS